MVQSSHCYYQVFVSDLYVFLSILVVVFVFTDGYPMMTASEDLRNSSSGFSSGSNLSKGYFPATCSPENETLSIPVAPNRSEIYFPKCIKIPRCSGCCPSDRLTCQPTEISRVNVEVMVVRYVSDSRRFKYAGRRTFNFERHHKCDCQCIQKESDCGPQHIYKKEECRCVCRDLVKAESCSSDPNKFWDSTKCSCTCLHRLNCSSSLHFNETTCSCHGSQSSREPLVGLKGETETRSNDLQQSPLWEDANTFRLSSASEHDSELNQMDKYHRTMGFQGINPQSQKLVW